VFSIPAGVEKSWIMGRILTELISFAKKLCIYFVMYFVCIGVDKVVETDI
jgi:hypothetical protein